MQRRPELAAGLGELQAALLEGGAGSMKAWEISDLGIQVMITGEKHWNWSSLACDRGFIQEIYST